MKKICFVDFDMSKTGGVEKVTTSLVNALSDFYEVHLISVQYENGHTPYQVNDNVKFISFNDKSKRLYEVSGRVFCRFRSYIVENQIDVVLLMGQYAAYASLFVQKSVKTKFIYCDHGALRNQWDDKKITTIRFLASRCSERVVTLTDVTKQDYLRRFKTSKKKVSTIYNWIDERLQENITSYAGDSQKIISVGRISEEKGYDMLVKVAKKVLPKHPTWTWDLYGDGNCFQEIKSSIEKEGLEHQLILKGNVVNVSELYQKYSFLVLTSYREGLPLVLLEAKAKKLPVVSFDIATGPREIIRDQLDGLLIEPYNLDKMADAIEYLMEESGVREEMSRNSGGNLEKFRKEIVLQQWITLINNLA